MGDQLHPIVEESPLARRAFAGIEGWPIVWLVARLWLGFGWLQAGWGKVTGEGWLDGGAALRGFASGAVERSQGEHPAVAYDWYVVVLEFIRDSAHPWLAPIVAVGQVVIGIALILGAFVGIAALLGLVLNFSFVLAGSAGVNPVFMIVGLFLLLAWRNAGYLGLDRWLLPAVGTPWVRPPDDPPAPTPTLRDREKVSV